ncbi:DoxX family protein [Kibdelosporangium aridum]|uniref:DoxX family protein n=1 Tax=Kibdelosporangium aridum TaxID=2030 RepID=A0A428YPQ8_KIBAR|nr:DoxX family protein [Kibdelosporangium aridum]RSM70521.1 DoxX family protein [Kibdelosporangium aridum]
MFIATIIVSAVLALLLLLSGVGKLRKDPMQMATQRKVGFPEDKVWILAFLEIAATFGLVIGLFWPPIGVAAAIGSVLYFIGAVGAHLRVKDWNVAIPGAILLLSAAALVLRVLSI